LNNSRPSSNDRLKSELMPSGWLDMDVPLTMSFSAR